MARLRFLLAFSSLATVVAVAACNEVLDNQPGILVDAPLRDGGARPIGSSHDGGTSEPPPPPRNDGCEPGSKSCGGACVSASDPHFGCAAASCDRCTLVHASATCSAGACAVAACDLGFADCNQNAADGCEADLASVQSCGACGIVCAAPKDATAACTAGLCTFTCEPDRGDCNHDPQDGCEADLRDDKRNCGACGTICIFGGKCKDGVCRWEWD